MGPSSQLHPNLSSLHCSPIEPHALKMRLITIVDASTGAEHNHLLTSPSPWCIDGHSCMITASRGLAGVVTESACVETSQLLKPTYMDLRCHSSQLLLKLLHLLLVLNAGSQACTFH
jgi:hypothetical protein